MPPQLTKYQVLKKNWITHDVFELVIKKPEGTTFEGGQYMSIVIPGAGPGGRNLRRAYSIASSPENATIELCVKKVEGGPGTTYLSSLDAGSEFEAQMPFGDFVLEHDMSLPVIFISTGTGVAPMRSMVLSKAWDSSSEAAFLFGVRAEKDIFYPDFYPELSGGTTSLPIQSTKNIKVCLSRPETANWSGFKGRVTDYLKKMDWDFARSHYYLCGSGAMLTEVKEFLMGTHGVSKEQIHTEKYY